MQFIQIAESKGLKSGQLYLSTLVQKNNQDRTGLYYEGYIVDENNNSYRRIEEQFLTNNKEKAVLVHYGEHFLICYENGNMEEYKKNGELLCRLSQSQEVLPESFCKYTMARIWF